MAPMPKVLKISVSNPRGQAWQAFAENNGWQVAE
jgi:hypothetical protein